VVSAFRRTRPRLAGVAQLVEQLIRNQQVVGSSPTAGSILNRFQSRVLRTALPGRLQTIIWL
jgi:hypothetical protein